MTDRITADTDVPERSTKFDLGHAHPVLAVADIDAAIAHYRETLGFFLEWARYDEDGGGGIANLWRGSLSLFLKTDDRFGPSCVYVHVIGRAEVDAVHADLVAAGARVGPAPAERPWGIYDMWFDDPDDNRFHVACFADDVGCSP